MYCIQFLVSQYLKNLRSLGHGKNIVVKPNYCRFNKLNIFVNSDAVMKQLTDLCEGVSVKTEKLYGGESICRKSIDILNESLIFRGASLTLKHSLMRPACFE